MQAGAYHVGRQGHVSDVLARRGSAAFQEVIVKLRNGPQMLGQQVVPQHMGYDHVLQQQLVRLQVNNCCTQGLPCPALPCSLHMPAAAGQWLCRLSFHLARVVAGQLAGLAGLAGMLISAAGFVVVQPLPAVTRVLHAVKAPVRQDVSVLQHVSGPLGVSEAAEPAHRHASGSAAVLLQLQVLLLGLRQGLCGMFSSHARAHPLSWVKVNRWSLPPEASNQGSLLISTST